MKRLAFLALSAAAYGVSRAAEVVADRFADITIRWRDRSRQLRYLGRRGSK